MHDPFRLAGTTIAEKYRVDRPLGEGGFGVVYAGTQTLLGQPVAIKCMKPFGGSPAEVAHTVDVFMREARVLFSLTHPAIVRLYDVGVLEVGIDRVPYVVLELLEGITLEKELARRAQAGGPHFSAREIASIFEPVLDAVAFAHERGIAHRDLKPANVMLVHGAQVSAKVLDFGTALVGQPVQSSMRRTGFTPRYAAPEQWDVAHGPTGPATDVFALGLTLAETCLMRPVFDGGAPQIIAAALDPARRPRVSAGRPDLPPALDEIVQRAMRVEIGERYPTARDMLVAFRAAMSQIAPAAATVHDAAPMSPFGVNPTAPSVPIVVAATPPPPAPPAAVTPMGMTPGLTPQFGSSNTTSAPLSREATQSLMTGRTAPSSGSGGTAALVLALLAVVGAILALGIAGFALLMMRRDASPAVAATSASATPASPATAATAHVTPTTTPPETPTSKGQAVARPTATPTSSLGSAPVVTLDAGGPPPPPAKGGRVVCTRAFPRLPQWTAADTQDVFDRGKPGLEACYASARGIDPAFAGNMGTLMLSVEASGVVTSGTCHVTEHLNKPAEQAFCSCAVHSAGRWRFPKPRAAGEPDGAILFSFSLQQ